NCPATFCKPPHPPTKPEMNDGNKTRQFGNSNSDKRGVHSLATPNMYRSATQPMERFDCNSDATAGTGGCWLQRHVRLQLQPNTSTGQWSRCIMQQRR